MSHSGYSVSVYWGQQRLYQCAIFLHNPSKERLDWAHMRHAVNFYPRDQRVSPQEPPYAVEFLFWDSKCYRFIENSEKSMA